jgi:hypothetical protein
MRVHFLSLGLACLLSLSPALADSTSPVPLDSQTFGGGLAEFQASLREAVQALDRTLAQSKPGYAEGWKTYLHWDALEHAVAGQPDAAALKVSLERFQSGKNGLQQPKFAAVRERLTDYLDALEAASELQSEQVAAIVPAIALDGPPAASSLPNLFGQASERFLAAGFNGYVDRTTPVTDEILGTYVRGVARFQASQTLDAVPSAYDGRLNILLRGNIYSRSTGYNGPVVIQNSGVTSVVATKQLVINENGLFALPARTCCRTSTKIHSICAKCALIERIAWKRAGKQKGEAEAIASNHAAARVSTLVDREALGQLAQANAQYQAKFRKPLLERGYTPGKIHVTSGNYGLSFKMSQQAGADGPQATPGPQLPAEADLAVAAHESYVSNMSTAIIGALELTDEKLAQMMKDATGEVPEELQITDEKEPWSITFAAQAPVTATFDGNRTRIAVRAERFTRGRNDDGTVDQEVKGLVEISATYSIERGETGARLVRDGDVTVDFVGQEKLNAAQVGTKTFLRRKFGSLFKPEMVGEGLKLKGRWERLGALRLREVRAENGWVQVAWQLP